MIVFGDCCSFSSITIKKNYYMDKFFKVLLFLNKGSLEFNKLYTLLTIEFISN